MLLNRVLTAVPLIALLLWAVVAAPAWVFPVLVLVALFLAAREWCLLSGPRQASVRYGYAVAQVVVVVVVSSAPVIVHWLVVGSVAAAWLLAVPLLAWYPRFQPQWLVHPVGKLAVGTGVLVGAGVGITDLHSANDSIWPLLGLFIAIWVSDTGAYFTGRSLGRHKLLPAVSPGKTIEGLIGGVGLVVLVAGLAAVFGPAPFGRPVFWVGAGVTVALFGVVGDLLESWLKREAGVKDSGTLLPGHGGMLDRIDSLCAAAPVAALLVMMAGSGGEGFR